jgi:hypothetical protein
MREDKAVQLLALPSELLLNIIAALPAADQWRLAGVCHILRSLVLNQAARLTLSLEHTSVANSKLGLRAALLASVRRPHATGKLTLRVKCKNARNILEELRRLGPCPAVTRLELESVPVGGGYLHVCNRKSVMQAAGNVGLGKPSSPPPRANLTARA